MAKITRRKKSQEAKKARRSARYNTEGKGNSRYAKKRAYLNREGGWGHEYLEPKPWR